MAGLGALLVGAPLPITVLQQIRVGLRVSWRAASIAALTSEGLWPLTSLITCQPYALKRPGCRR